MKKIITLFFIFLLSFYIATGCTNNTKNTSEPVIGISLNELEKPTEITLSELKDESILKSFEREIYILKQTKGYVLFQQPNNEYIIFIFLGEKSTGGYDLTNFNLEVKEKDIIISFEEVKPKEFSTQVISYPYKVLYLAGDIHHNIIVKSQYETLTEQQLITYEYGKFIEQVDSHSIKVELYDEVTLVYSITDIKDIFDKLNLAKGDLIEIGYIHENNQLVLKDIIKRD